MAIDLRSHSCCVRTCFRYAPDMPKKHAIRKATCINCERQELGDTHVFSQGISPRTCHFCDQLKTPRYASSVDTEDQEIVERSEGGYRTKRKVIPGTAPEPKKESKPGCLSKCCLARNNMLTSVKPGEVLLTYNKYNIRVLK